LSQGAIAPWRTPAHRKLQRELLEFAERRGIPIDRPFRLLTKTQVRRIVDGDGSKRFRGIRGFAEDLANRSDSRTSSKLLNRWLGHRVCPTCDGARLKAEARAVQVGGVDIASLCSRTIAEVQSFLADPDRLGCLDGLTRRTLAPLCARLDILRQVGVDDLTLNRPIRTLSRGEFQRVSLSASLSSGLIHTLYVLDEPSTGLHPQEMGPLVEALRSLRNLGNTVVVVDHDPAILQAADWLIDLGPGAGRAGGLVVYQGPPEGVENAPQSRTGRALASESRPPGSRRPTSAENRLVLRGASGRNLKDIDVAFPLRAFCVVTGLSGSGKSSLIQETLYPALVQRLQNKPRAGLPFRELQGTEPLDRVDHLDATPIGRSGRSNPATYLGAYDFIRKTFAETHEAKTRNYRAGRFSFNVPGGRCEACQGQGFQTIDMRFLSDVVVRCPECRGTRFRQETLDVTYRGKSIAEVLDLTIRDAFGFFRNRHKIQSRLQPALEIGLDYLVLGQPAATLSAGEAQRLKIARFLADSLAALRRNTQEARSLLILDEPTRGLHPDDVRNLLIGLDALVDRGHSLIVIEHDPMVMAHADWIIDLGPAAGPRGGQVIAQGTPEQVAKSGTPTGLVLRRVLGIPDGEP
jgi:excinuclease ABC subunit A